MEGTKREKNDNQGKHKKKKKEVTTGVNDIQLPGRLFVALFRAKLATQVDQKRDEHTGE